VAYKTASKNLQRWTVANDKFTKERLKPETYDFKLDFSNSLYYVQDFLKGIVVVCEHCKQQMEFDKNALRKMFALDTKFHVVFSRLKNGYVCPSCGCGRHVVYFEKIQLTKSEFRSIVERQNKEILLKEQKMNRDKLRRDGVVAKKDTVASPRDNSTFGVSVFSVTDLKKIKDKLQ